VQHGEQMQMRPLLCFLQESYTEHIESMDREYGPWFNGRGVD
jgi:hemerythrin